MWLEVRFVCAVTLRCVKGCSPSALCELLSCVLKSVGSVLAVRSGDSGSPSSTREHGVEVSTVLAALWRTRRRRFGLGCTCLYDGYDGKMEGTASGFSLRVFTPVL